MTQLSQKAFVRSNKLTICRYSQGEEDTSSRKRDG